MAGSVFRAEPDTEPTTSRTHTSPEGAENSAPSEHGRDAGNHRTRGAPTVQESTGSTFGTIIGLRR